MNQRVWRAVSSALVAAFAVLSAACAGAPINKPIEGGPVEIGAGTVTNARKFLEGTWTLTSYDVYPPNQPALHLDATGYLAYDDFGNMTIELRTSPETAQALARFGMPAPKDGVISTTGKTILDMPNKTLVYVLDGQAVVRPAAGLLDTNRLRYWEVEANKLTLRTKDDAGKVVSLSVWERR